MDTDTNIITVIIPVYNRENQIVRTLDSVASQDLTGIEVIIVDNGSSDNSFKTVEDWITRREMCDFTLRSELSRGAPAARNKGLEMTETPYVMFFDSDDEMMPGHLEMVKKGLTDYPEADILGWEIDQELPSGRRQIGRFDDNRPLYRHLVHSILSTQRYIVRTDVIRKVGGWNTSVRGWNDYELGVRLLLSGAKVVRLNKDKMPTVRINFTQMSITGHTFSDDCDKWEHALNMIENELSSACRRALPWLSYRRAVLSADYLREKDFRNSIRLFRQALDSGAPRLLTVLLFMNHLIFHRGSWIIASRFLPADF